MQVVPDVTQALAITPLLPRFMQDTLSYIRKKKAGRGHSLPGDHCFSGWLFLSRTACLPSHTYKGFADVLPSTCNFMSSHRQTGHICAESLGNMRRCFMHQKCMFLWCAKNRIGIGINDVLTNSNTSSATCWVSNYHSWAAIYNVSQVIKVKFIWNWFS